MPIMNLYELQQNKLKKKRFGMYFLSYICVVLPLILVSIIMTSNSAERMNVQQKESMQFQMNRVIRELEDTYYAFQNAAIILAEDSNFIRDNMAQHKSHTIEAMRTIKQLNNCNHNLHEMFVHYSGDTRVFSAFSTNEITAYGRLNLNLTETAADQMREMLNEKQQVRFFPSYLGVDSSFVVFHWPINQGVFNNGDSVNFVMRVRTLTQKIVSLAENSKIVVEMDFNGGEKLYMYGDNKNLQAVEAETLPPVDNDYTLITVQSDTLGINMKVYYEKTQIFGEIQHIYLLNILLILFGTLIALILSYVLGRTRYMQIKKMFSIVSRGKEDIDLPDEGRLEHLTEQLVKDYDEMSSLMTQTDSILRRQVSHMIFSGMLYTEDDIRQRMNICGLDMYEEYYTVICITVNENPEALDVLEENLIGDLYYQTKIDGKRTEIVLLQLPVPDSSREISLVITDELAEIVRKAGGIGVRFAFSRVYDDITQIGNAYLESVCVLEGMNQLPNTRYYAFWENMEHLADRDIQRMLLSQLEKALERRNEEQVMQTWLDIAAHCVNNPENQRYMHYYMLNVLAQTIKKENPIGYDHLRMQVNNSTEFMQSAEQLLRDYCQVAEQDSFAQVLEYLDNNYHRYDLSINEVANQVGLNRSYLSTLFKQRTGFSYMDYLTQLRMTRVQDLLRNTDLSIREIVQQVGYVDENNFRKKFKNMYGISASEFRKKGKK